MKHKNMMEKISQSKKNYDSIEIPDELDQITSVALHSAEKENVNFMKRKKYLPRFTVVAASVFLCFIAGLNTSSAFAAAVGDVPGLGGFSKILTFRTYDYADQDKAIHMEIPMINEADGATELKSNINKEISISMEKYKADAENRIAEYKDAFIGTGGTEAEFAEKEIRIDAGYQIFHESEDILSFAINANENWSGAYGICHYYNIDLKAERSITLQDLLGDRYEEIAIDSIQKQMKERMEADKKLLYWDESNGIEASIIVNNDTDFYINKKGNPVIVFEKYAIAAGAYGPQEFEISSK